MEQIFLPRLSGKGLKRRYRFESFRRLASRVRLRFVEQPPGMERMDTELRIERWNAQWIIVAGRAVCTHCMESQPLKDSEASFVHAGDCTPDSAELRPWVALHDILDAERG